MSKRISVIALLWAVLYGCSGTIPDIHYYLIDYEVAGSTDRSEPVHRVVLGVSPFDAAPLYQEERLVYRDSPYEGKYYHYHRWVSRPTLMITEKTIEHLRAAKLFTQVVPFPKYSQVDYLLQGTIKALEEWDEGNQWYARVQIAFELVDPKSKQLSWHTVIEQKVPAQQKTPGEIVKAINIGVQRCLNELEKQLNAHFLN